MMEPDDERRSRVLIGDSDEAVRRLLSDELRDTGFMVVEAADGRETLRQATYSGLRFEII